MKQQRIKTMKPQKITRQKFWESLTTNCDDVYSKMVTSGLNVFTGKKVVRTNYYVGDVKIATWCNGYGEFYIAP